MDGILHVSRLEADGVFVVGPGRANASRAQDGGGDPLRAAKPAEARRHEHARRGEARRAHEQVSWKAARWIL